MSERERESSREREREREKVRERGERIGKRERESACAVFRPYLTRPRAVQ